MRIVLEPALYEKLHEKAKANGKTTRELSVTIITDWLNKK